MTRRYKPVCCRCGDVYSSREQSAGYHLCIACRTETPSSHRKANYLTKVPAHYRDWNNDDDVLNWAMEKYA